MTHPDETQIVGAKQTDAQWLAEHPPTKAELWADAGWAILRNAPGFFMWLGWVYWFWICLSLELWITGYITIFLLAPVGCILGIWTFLFGLPDWAIELAT